MIASDRSLELRGQLRERLTTARARTDALFELVRPEALYERPIPERHRIAFYIGHLEAFDANLLLDSCLGREPLRPDFERLFAFGIDPIDGRLPDDEPADWPPVEEIRAYNQQARRTLDTALATIDYDQPPSPFLEQGWAVTIAVEHRLMHAETLAYMLHRLPYDSKRRGPAPGPPGVAPKPRLVEIPAGRATLGLERARQPTLGWDNEYEAHELEVPAFAIEAHDVTNGDWLRFMEAGGYQERSFWDAPAWAWLAASGVRHPGFWVERPGGWWCRGMFGETPLDPSTPVWVSHSEASAYARWRGRQLPSEAEFHRAAYGRPDGGERAFPWGEAGPGPRHGAFGFSSWDPSPIGTHPAGDSGFGVSDLVGNGWEWTRTVFAPFDGFEPLPFYRGYSADFFDGLHYVMKGGSPRTDASLLRRSFRNWFQPHYPHVYATFRCVVPRG